MITLTSAHLSAHIFELTSALPVFIFQLGEHLIAFLSIYSMFMLLTLIFAGNFLCWILVNDKFAMKVVEKIQRQFLLKVQCMWRKQLSVYKDKRFFNKLNSAKFSNICLLLTGNFRRDMTEKGLSQKNFHKQCISRYSSVVYNIILWFAYSELTVHMQNLCNFEHDHLWKFACVMCHFSLIHVLQNGKFGDHPTSLTHKWIRPDSIIFKQAIHHLSWWILYLYLFSGRIQFWHLQPRFVHFKKLVALMDSFSEAVNCLCAGVTLFQLVPLTYISNKEWVFILFRVRIRNFETLWMICWKFFHNICSMEVRLYTWFDMSLIPNGNEELVSIDCWYHTLHNFV